MIHVANEALIAYLSSKGFSPSLQEETGQIYVPLSLSEKEFPLFIRIMEGEILIQLLTFIPCKITKGAEGDLARLLHMLNRELDAPGFGMDEEAQVVFYRCMVPCSKKRVDEALFENYLKATLSICESFAAPIAAVASKTKTFQDILNLIKREQSAQYIKP